MDPEDVLDLLLRQLPLDAVTVKFIREVFREIRESFTYKSSTGLRKELPTKVNNVQDTAAKLREVIAFFNSADDDRDEFLVKFPEWETERKRNIQKLRKSAESIHESRQACSVAQIVGGGVGAIGGLAVIGSILFPPAAAVLLPGFLLPAATVATSSLAVGGSIAAGAGSIAQVVTSVTEATILSNLITETRQICQQDKESFNKMIKWFERTHQLETAVNHLFGTNILDIIFRDLKEYFGSSTLNSKMFRCDLTKCVRKILGTRCDPSLMTFPAAVTAVTFSVFLVRRRNRCLLQCVNLTHKLGFGLITAFKAKAQVGRLLASTVMKKGKGKLIRKAIASKVATGALAGIGIALDLANMVVNAEDLEKGSKSEVQEKIIEVADELQSNLDFVREVHREIWSAAKKASEEYLDALIVDQLGLSGNTKLIHEIYQDVLQETRKLRRSRSCRKFVQMDPSSNSLRKVIDFFNKAEKESEIFCNDFRQWENIRKENVKYLYFIAESLQKVKKFRSEAPYVDLIEGARGTTAIQRSQCFVNTAVKTCKTAIDNSNATTIVKQLRERTEEARRICRRDREDLFKMEGWYPRMHQLSFAFDDLFGKGMFDNIFMDLEKFCGGGIWAYRYSLTHQVAFKHCVSKIFSRPTQIDPSIREAVIAVFFSLVLEQRRSVFYLRCFNETMFGGRRWISDFTVYLDQEESLLQTLDVDSVEGRVVLLDTIKTVFKLAKTDETAFRELADQLQDELDSMGNWIL